MHTEAVGQGRWALFYLPEHCYTLSESVILATNMTRLVNLAVLLVLGVCGAVAMETTMSELKEELKALKETTEGLKLKLELSELSNIELQDRVTRLEKGKARRQVLVDANPEVGFTATATADEHYLHIDQPIIYDHVITNIGNAFDPKTGLFHCPVTGTYLFNFNIMAAESDYVEGSLVVNGQHVVHALSDHQDGTTSWDMGTTNVVIRLNEGDVVSVGIQWPAGDNTVHGNKFNTFSGYLLRAL